MCPELLKPTVHSDYKKEQWLYIRGLNRGEEAMKTLLLLVLAGSAIGFGLPTFAQQTNTPDPQLRQMLDALT